MHSRIYTIFSDKERLAEKMENVTSDLGIDSEIAKQFRTEISNEDEIFDAIKNCADYVSFQASKENWKEDVEELVDSFGNIEHETINSEDVIKIVITSEKLEDYFGSKMKSLKNKAKDLSLNDFLDVSDASELSDTIDNEFGYYVVSDELGVTTLDYFLRFLGPGTYYIGATYDYHF